MVMPVLGHCLPFLSAEADVGVFGLTWWMDS